jgi:hypothetical protein
MLNNLVNIKICNQLSDGSFRQEILNHPEVALGLKHACSRLSDKQFDDCLKRVPTKSLMFVILDFPHITNRIIPYQEHWARQMIKLPV